MSNEPRITAVIPAKNEAHRIKDCLDALRGFAQQVIVVDDGSTDETVGIAESLGADVVHAQRDGRPLDWLNTLGFKAATGDWILRIDADEHLTPTLARELRRVALSGEYTGVRFPRKNMMFGGWARHGGWFVSDQLRFFRRDAWDDQWDCKVHTQVPVRGPILRLPAREAFATVHHDYQSIRQFVKRSLMNYAHQDALERFLDGQRFSARRALIQPTRKFLGRYFVRQGFRDGRRGLVLAMLLAVYELCTEFYLWDCDREAKPCG